MKKTHYALIALLAFGSAPAFAKGDGYDRSYQFNQKVREDQQRLWGKKNPEVADAGQQPAKRSEPPASADEKKRNGG
ncbi:MULTISPECIES: hypothetical protein [unclassified Pseudomonas]|uniref:hypothetical protein n=1 Tax=unclassified Pseudomonas TaxID=196821 RepID=UPI001BCE2625|nr:hypothetical protein [Pseudomonas sp. Pc102]BBP83816.1 hypothetical protein PHLH8_34580 [Pseudomonas sp. Pc102]